MRDEQQAFSLIELLIVIAICGILLAVSWPAYQRYVLRGYRAQATTLLLKLANAQVQHHADYGYFSSELARLGYAAEHSPRYDFTVRVASNGHSFELEAAAIGAQSADAECARFSLNQIGQRNQHLPYNVSCWN